MTIPFTSDLQRLSESFLSATVGGLNTSLRFARCGSGLGQGGKNSRREILVISDGIDGHSHTKFEDLRSKVLQSSASLDVLEFWTGHSYDLLEPQPLGDLASLAGGMFFDDVSPRRFPEYFADIDPHQSYVLSFEASDISDKKQHRLEVRLRNVLTSKPKVFWKHVYTN